MNQDTPQDESDIPLPNGVDERGRLLPELQPEALGSFAQREATPSAAESISRARSLRDETSFGVVADVDDPNDLAQAGWGVLFGAGADPEVKRALQPLLDRRREQAGALFKVFEGPDGCQPGEGATAWLARRGVRADTVDPLLGVPFYLLLVGPPQEIPFEFQYALDVYWGVGRVAFDTPDEYRRYAESVVAYETAARPPHGRRVAVFATRHDFDRATQLFATQVAQPLVQGTDQRGPLGQRWGFGLQHFVGDPATKAALAGVLRGDVPGGPPAILFTGSHGMELRPSSSQHAAAQGALVCQDWSGFGSISAAHWFAAGDVPPDASVHGLIHFFFACYGAGCPRLDSFANAPQGTEPRQIAERDFVARLPQALLSHPRGGALAALGHIDRAWSYSFVSDRGKPQLQGFRDVLGRLMRGDRLGLATDEFNMRWAALSAELADALRGRGFGDVSDRELASRWVARDDARNYVALGDPAVRLRVEEMAPA
jgi:hypothetical protein